MLKGSCHFRHRVIVLKGLQNGRIVGSRELDAVHLVNCTVSKCPGVLFHELIKLAIVRDRSRAAKFFA